MSRVSLYYYNICNLKNAADNIDELLATRSGKRRNINHDKEKLASTADSQSFSNMQISSLVVFEAKLKTEKAFS